MILHQPIELGGPVNLMGREILNYDPSCHLTGSFFCSLIIKYKLIQSEGDNWVYELTATCAIVRC